MNIRAAFMVTNCSEQHRRVNTGAADTAIRAVWSTALVIICLAACGCSRRLVEPPSAQPAPPLIAVTKTARFGYETVRAMAAQLSFLSYRQPQERLPPEWNSLGYDQWRDIRFKTEYSLWQNSDSLFTIRYFPLGYLYRQPVTISIVDQKGVHPVRLSPEWFDVSAVQPPLPLPEKLQPSGFRIYYPLHHPEIADEVMVFLGASYFRAVGARQQYGLSARGLAIDTGVDNATEEFPLFRSFWIEKPTPQASRLTIYALLDSPSVSGAYEFIIQPGTTTEIAVRCSLFFRRQVKKLGIAPLTSMFYYGEHSWQRPPHDFRPEVHDSDGLLIAFPDGEFFWRPIVNEERILFNTFHHEQTPWFDLQQRDRIFANYQDLEARYDIRPSCRVIPAQNWGPGHVELIQIPTENEYHDNIVCFWQPQKLPKAKSSVTYAYTLQWHTQETEPPQSRVLTTFMSAGAAEEERVFIVDFSDSPLPDAPPPEHLSEPQPDVWVAEEAMIKRVALVKHPVINGWRLILHITLRNRPVPVLNLLQHKKYSVELRAHLRFADGAVSETWSFSYSP